MGAEFLYVNQLTEVLVTTLKTAIQHSNQKTETGRISKKHDLI